MSIAASLPTSSRLVQYYQLKWQGWDKPTN